MSYIEKDYDFGEYKPEPESKCKPKCRPEPECKCRPERKPEPECKCRPERKPEPECECRPKCKPEPECKCRPERKCTRVLLQAISSTPQTVISGLAVPFTTNLVNVGNGISHTPGSTEFILTCPGTYRVTFTGTVAATGEIIFGNVGVALAANGIILPGTTVTETVATSGNEVALATQAIVRVAQCQTVIFTVVNPAGVTEIFTNPNIIIERIS